MIFQNLHKFKNKTAFIENNNKYYSYQDLINSCNFLSEKILKRSLVLILCENNYESISFYIACLRNKNIPILLDAKTDTEYVKQIIKIYKPDYIFIRKVNKIKGYLTIKKLEKYKLLENHPKSLKKIYKNLALLLSTSGTTGSSKMVRLSYKNIFSNTYAIIKYLKIKSHHRMITTLPFNYSYGLSQINTHIESGATIILNEYSVIQKNFWDLFYLYKVTSISGVPYTFEMLKRTYKNLLINNFFKYATLAGGKLDDKSVKFLYEKFKQNNKKLIIMYGQTEASPRMSYLPWDKFKNNFNSIGKPIPNGKFFIKNKMKYKAFSKQGIGELYYKGENVFLGYAKCLKDLSKKDEYKGMLNTNDLAFKKHNLYFLFARYSRIIKCFGKRVNLDDIEQQLKKLNIEAVCKGTENNLKVYYINKIKEKKIKEKKIKDLLFVKMLIPKSITNILKVNKIAKQLSGKVDYMNLEKYIDVI